MPGRVPGARFRPLPSLFRTRVGGYASSLPQERPTEPSLRSSLRVQIWLTKQYSCFGVLKPTQTISGVAGFKVIRALSLSCCEANLLAEDSQHASANSGNSDSRFGSL